jgi:hypothetical protein
MELYGKWQTEKKLTQDIITVASLLHQDLVCKKHKNSFLGLNF